MPKKHTFLVTLSVPDWASLKGTEVFIEEAIKAMCELGAGYDPAGLDVVAAATTRPTGEARKAR